MSPYQDQVITAVVVNDNNKGKGLMNDDPTSVITSKQKGILVRGVFVLVLATAAVTLTIFMGGRGGKEASLLLRADATADGTVAVEGMVDGNTLDVGCLSEVGHTCAGFGKGNCCDGYTCCSFGCHAILPFIPVPGCGKCVYYGNCFN